MNTSRKNINDNELKYFKSAEASQVRNIQTVNPFGRFGTAKKCMEEIFLARTTEACTCPGCGYSVRQNYELRKNRNEYMCKICFAKAPIFVGTLFQNGNLPIEELFYVIEQVFGNLLGITAKKLENRLNWSSPTCINTLHVIRKYISDLCPKQLNFNHVECDETFPIIGTGGFGTGSVEGSGNKNRTASVAVMVERGKGGKAVARVIPNTGPALKQFVHDTAVPGAHLYTDGNMTYRNLKNEGFEHEYVIHPTKGKKSGEFVLHSASTNKCENVNSFIKAMQVQHKFIAMEYIQDYVNEVVFKYNHGNEENAMMETFLKGFPLLKPVKSNFYRKARII